MCERTQSGDGTLLFLPRVCHCHNTFMCIIGKVNKNDGRSSTWTKTPGRQQQQQQTLLPFQIRLFTFQGRTRCSSSCLGFWAFKHKGTRIKYLSRLYVCLSKKFFRRQTEHQKSLSAAEGNVRERTRQAYAARYRVCFLCVFVPFIRWKLASDLSTYVILLSGRRGFPHSHMLHHIAHGEHVTVHRVCCFRCGNT